MSYVLKITIHGRMFNQDSLIIKSFAFGDFILRSKVYPEAENIITDSCNGQITGNVFFGKAGVGKSTVASLVSSKPGLFDVGTNSQGTTTLGLVFSSLVEDFFPIHHVSLTN